MKTSGGRNPYSRHGDLQRLRVKILAKAMNLPNPKFALWERVALSYGDGWETELNLVREINKVRAKNGFDELHFIERPHTEAEIEFACKTTGVDER